MKKFDIENVFTIQFNSFFQFIFIRRATVDDDADKCFLHDPIKA